MTVTLDELIKWILSQCDEKLSDEQRAVISRRVFGQVKEDNNGQE